MLKSVLATGTAFVALYAASAAPAHAQVVDAATVTTAEPGREDDWTAAPEQPNSDIFVTGSTRAQRRFDAS